MVVADWAAAVFIAALGCLLFGSIAPLLAFKRQQAANWLAHGSAFLGGTGAALAALLVLLAPAKIDIAAWQLLPGLVWRLRVDELSAFFLLVIAFLVAVVAVYSMGYVTKYYGKKNIAYLGSLFNVFALSMIAVVTVTSSVTFLIAWEVMSLVSFLLVMFEHEKLQVRTAGYIYLVMTHIATVFITLSFLILFSFTKSVDFTGYSQQLAALPDNIKNLVFLMCLVGFGAKAGLIPLHVWLPRAHPVAPSNISALMSAVMLKTAIYGLLRITYDFFGGGAAWWGGLLLVLGVGSAIFGILMAIAENDVKRFLAYSSTENMGIILAAVGAALLFQAHEQPVLAAVALTAALFHILSHAWFKSLLFMGAGAVLFATHTKNINELGGLIKRMPWTAGMFLLGGLSLAALPPLSGVVSEWLVLQSMLHLVFDLNVLALQLGGAAAVALLALTGAFAAGGVIKHFGTAFLAMPRSQAAAEAKEVPLLMRVGMGLVAILLILGGLWPGAVLTLTNRITGVYYAEQLSGSLWMVAPFAGQGGAVLTVAVIGGVAALLLASGLLLLRKRFGPGRVIVDETWNCGGRLKPDMAYTGTGFSHPVLVIFQKLMGLNRQVEVEAKYRYYPQKIRHFLVVNANVETLLYRPLIAGMLYMSQRLRTIQNGNLQNYLAYMVGALVIALIWTR